MITTKIKEFQNTNDYDISIYKNLKAEVNYFILVEKRNWIKIYKVGIIIWMLINETYNLNIFET